MMGSWTSLPQVREGNHIDHKKSIFKLRFYGFHDVIRHNLQLCINVGLSAPEFGFDENQTVALLGAHTLGQVSKHFLLLLFFLFFSPQKQFSSCGIGLQMKAENSGHQGVWTVGQANDFNNQYFKVPQTWLSDSDQA